jgi:hypothetical protein
MKSMIFWVVIPYTSQTARHFREGRIVSQAIDQENWKGGSVGMKDCEKFNETIHC